MRLTVLIAAIALTSCATSDPNEPLITPMLSSVLIEVQKEFQKPLE
jgi:hypothetical protein